MKDQTNVPTGNPANPVCQTGLAKPKGIQMNAMNQQPNTGGRPPHYTYSQVTTAVRRLEDAGTRVDTIDAKSVKELLVKEFGVSAGVRESSLKDYVSAAVLARTEEQNEALLRNLPADVVSALETAVATLHEQMTLTIARQNLACQRAADQRCDELTEDKQNLRGVNLDLASQLEVRDPSAWL